MTERVFNSNFPVIRIFLGIWLVLSLTVMELVGLTFLRMTELPLAAWQHCNPRSDSFEFCSVQIGYQMLYEPRWRAVKFTVYIFTATVVFWLLFRGAVGKPMVNVSVAGGVAAVLLLLFIKVPVPGLIPVEPLACFFGALLAGLLISRRRSRQVVVHEELAGAGEVAEGQQPRDRE